MSEQDRQRIDELQQSINERFMGIVKDHQTILEGLCAAFTSLDERILALEKRLEVLCQN